LVELGTGPVLQVAVPPPKRSTALGETDQAVLAPELDTLKSRVMTWPRLTLPGSTHQALKSGGRGVLLGVAVGVQVGVPVWVTVGVQVGLEVSVAEGLAVAVSV
jgi:hypothetical protein